MSLPDKFQIWILKWIDNHKYLEGKIATFFGNNYTNQNMQKSFSYAR